MHEDGVDLISKLPDLVLLLILSGLPSTKESIRTSILSSRWRSLWTSIPSLNFEYRGGWNRQKSQFINIVNWAFLQRPVEYRGGWNRPEDITKFKNIVNWAFLHRSVNLDSFHLSCSDFFSTSTIERWIDQTVLRNVKQLDLWFWGKSVSDDMEMPHCLATCASLEILKLCLGRRLIVPSLSGFPALRVLKLEYVELCDDDLVEYILDCPLLEELTLDDCWLHKLDLLCISCPKLKKLSLSYIGEDDLCGCLKVSCPNLVFLAIQGQIASNYIFESLYSLKEALIDPDSYGLLHLFHAISRLFHFISHVESLWTNLSFLYEYCINAARDPALPNLKTLELTTVNDNCTVKGLKKILNICPKLESLVLTVENDHTYEEEKQKYNETEYPNLDEVGTWNLTPDVAWVEFFEYNGEKPKLTIDWYDKNKSKWTYVAAKWGNSLDGPMFYQLW